VAAGTDRSLRIALVSAPGTSVFMVELLDAVAAAVRALGRGVEVVAHRGLVSEIVDARTVAVVVPHEYFVLAPPEPESLRARTVSFGVEHPGTEEFEVSARYAATLAARFEISAPSVAALAGRGVATEQFELGPAPGWDRRAEAAERDVDVVYLGTADPRRLGILAGAARDLAGLRTELVVAPHEQMTGPRPDFLTGSDKWRLLARSKVLVNLHRGTKTSLEWVRVLEAVANGCAVVTEPSDDLDPLAAGTHLVVAEPGDVGRAAAALARDEPRRAALAEAALERCRTQLDLAGSARRLADACARVSASAPDPGVVAPAVARRLEQHRAVWLPAPAGGPPAPPGLVPAALARSSPVPPGDGRLAVLCTRLPGDGRVGTTVTSVTAQLPGVTVHVRRGGETAHRGAARNRLAAACDEELLAVLDAGDEVLGDSLDRMAELLRADPGLDAVLCPATYGDTLVNLVLPEAERLRERIYLTRGYVVRRRTLEALGGFTEAPELADLVDHHFWLSLTAGGGRTAVLRSVGVALRPG
jgi:Glycosyl transferases group 1